MEGHLDLATKALIILNFVSFSMLLPALWHRRKRQKSE